jgi:acyl transferase domain-containing protein/thioesterase domain-containing protein/SAM-dependent methyltransferase/acyl carrier protein/ribosomal protein S18 acetylase RimI-like enzyme
MLSLLNRYAHGYVAVPVIVSLREHGVLNLLSESIGYPFDRLVADTGANAGHLRIALRLLESLGWCRGDEHEGIWLTETARMHQLVPAQLLPLFDMPISENWVSGLGGDRLAELVGQSANRWGIQDERFADMVDGAFFIPLLLSLRQSLQLDNERIASLFVAHGWATRERELQLSELGRSLLDRIPITGMVASYRPMLARMDQLLFGDAAAVFARDEHGHESHVDRSLNVATSGFQHERFFTDLEEIVVDIFNRRPFEEQPNYVADMGCGDGTLLKRIYEKIRDASERGKVLNEFPITLIGIDYNEMSLAATASTLAGMPHLVLPGDISDPQRLLNDLRELGITDTESILHVRSFLDHDRPFQQPDDEEATRQRRSFAGSGVYTRRDGARLDSADVVQSLVEHLRRWSAITTRFGLITLEVHSLPPSAVHEFLDQSENLHYDTFHGFSGQFLVEPDQYLMAAAEAGLLPDPECLRRYPKVLPFTRITLSRFQPQPYIIRHARADDLAALVALEADCWAERLRATRATLALRIERYPEGQFVVETAGQVVGVLYTQRIADPLSLDMARDDNVEQLFDRNGRFVQLIAVNVASDRQQQGLGDQLAEFVLQLCSVTSSVERVVGVTRCRDYVHNSETPLAEYIQLRVPSGERRDPILRFHESHGAEINKLLPGYRPADSDNDGCGVLIGYDVRQRRAKRKQAAGLSAPEAEAPVADCSAVVSSAIRSILGPEREDAFALTRPFMEQDLDSMDLLELGTVLSKHFQRPIDATFFFNYPTPQAIIDYLSQTVAEVAKTSGDLLAKRALPKPGYEPIAIVGMGCRFPSGANSPEAYWQLLRNGTDAVTDIPSDRWDVDRYFDPDLAAPGKMYTRRGAFVDGVDEFDAAFFGITPREASDIDPQQRLLLEVTWQALEDAGIAPSSLNESETGVFIGLSSDDFATWLRNGSDPAGVNSYSMLGTARSVAAGRIAYVLGLQGPAVQLDTACSSSLMAVQQACQSLQAGEADLAIAGGVHLMLSPVPTVAFCKSTALAPDGRCKTFDAAADGYVRGEGCGIVVLKRLCDAVRDGDVIRATIRAAVANHDGASNGLAAPNGLAQEKLHRKALRKANLAGRDVTYVEAHGPGTSLGDPIEVESLYRAYGEGRSAAEPLLIGSVKTNIGHLEAAAGIAGLQKVVLMLQHGEIVPHLHFHTPNPHIAWEQMAIQIPTALTPWPQSEQPKLAAVSSFGVSGTNVHVIVGAAETVTLEAERVEPDSLAHTDNSTCPWHLFPLSAKSDAALKTLAANYCRYITTHAELRIEDTCFSAATTRDHFPYRIAVVAESREELLRKLQDYCTGADTSGVLTGDRWREQGASTPSIAFLFTGQGSQYVGMGRQLYESQPVFRAAIDRCEELLRHESEVSLIEALYSEPTSVDEQLDETLYAQPAIFALEYALAELWKSWGVQPKAVLGHSLGEYAAACTAGVFSLETGITLTATRGKLGQNLRQGGAMVVILADETRGAKAIAPWGDRVSIAAINGPETTVISGEADAVRAIAAKFEAEGIDTKPLNTRTAGHSALVEPSLGPFRAVADQLEFHSSKVALISNISGQVAGEEIACGEYWTRHIRVPVRFADGMRTLLATGCQTFVEIGPNPNLLAMEMGCLTNRRTPTCWLPSLSKGHDSNETMLHSLGELYVRGVDVDWSSFYKPYARSRVSLPTYAFQRQSFPRKPEACVPTLHASAHASGLRLNESQLPNPSTIAAKVDHLQSGLEDELRALTPRLDEIAIRFVIETVKQLGFRWHVGASFSQSALAARIPDRHLPKAHRVFSRLVERGYLEDREQTYCILKPEPEDTAAELLANLEREYEGPECDFLRRAGTALASIWQDEIEPLTILFPNGATDKAARFYSEARLLAGYNRLAGEVVRELVAALPPGQELRVLEVGAGTGGLTMHLLPQLPKDRTDYWFTDLSPLFLHAAKERFHEFPFLKTGLLDISKSPHHQDIALGSFDLVVAANVLHATPRLHDTLTNVRQFLKPNGWLMLLECYNPPLWGDVLFTMIDGWWNFEDRELRRDYPLLPPDGWRQVLAETGFRDVVCFNDSQSKDNSHNNLYLAQSGNARDYSVLTAAAAEEPFAKASPQATPIDSVTSPVSSNLGNGIASDLLDERELTVLIREHAARVMRLDPKFIEPNRPLSELGMDSLMAIELRTRLGETLGYELSLNPLRMRCSADEIAVFVHEDQQAPRHFQQSSGATLADLEIDVPKAHLVPLQPNGHKTPLFFVPAGYGDLLAFQDIATALGTDQPVYGLQPASAKQVKTIRQTSIYRLVSAYLAEIKQVQPDGPYQIAGYSAGAIVAIELARELKRQGSEVPLLIIFDPPSHVPFWLDWFYAANYWFCVRTGLIRVVRRVRSRLVARLFHTVMDEGLRTHTAVTREHRVEPYPGRITYFRATLSQVRLLNLKLVGRFWRRIAQGGIEVHWIPGTHYGMLRGPGASVVVDELNDCLQRSRMRKSS